MQAPLGAELLSYPHPLRGWWMAAVFCLAGFVSYADRLILSALVDPLRADLMISDSQVSLLQGAAFALVYVFSGLYLGRLVDRSHRLRVLLAGSWIWCAGVVLCGFAPDFWSLFASRMLIGLGEAALAPAAISLIADSFPLERRGAAVSFFLMGTVLGGPGAIAMGGVLLEEASAGTFAQWPIVGALAPWRAVLLLVGVAGFVVPLLFLTLREPPRRERTPDVSLRSVLQRFSRDRRVLAPLYMAMALISIGDYALLSWAPSLLVRRFAWGSGEVGLVFGLITVTAGAAGALAGGALSDAAVRRAGAHARLTIACVSAAGACIAAALIAAPSAIAVLAGVGLWTFASAVAGIGGIVSLQESIANEQRGLGVSLVAFCNILFGLGLGPTLVAQATERIYLDPSALGAAIATTATPAAIAALGLFVIARAGLRRRSG